MGIKRRKDSFFSRSGIESTLPHLEMHGKSVHHEQYSDTETGARRNLSFEIKKTPKGFKIRFSYDFHKRNIDNDYLHFLEINFIEHDDDIIEFDTATINHPNLSANLDVTDPEIIKKIEFFCSDFFDYVGKQNLWVNPIELLQKHGFEGDSIGKKAWPGLYVNGDIKRDFDETVPKKSSPEYSLYNFPSDAGVNAEHNIYQGKKIARHLSLHLDDGPDQFVSMSYTYDRGASNRHLSIKGIISAESRTKGEEETATLYEIETLPAKKKKDFLRIKKLAIDGYSIDINDPVAVTKSLAVIRKLNRAIRKGDKALINDLKDSFSDRRYALPTELYTATNLYPHMMPAIKIPKKGLMTVEINGGTPEKEVVSPFDVNIGCNQSNVSFYYYDENEEIKTFRIGIDAGIGIHGDGFDVIFYDPSKFFRHRLVKDHKPERLLDALYFTHAHEDHLGQIAYLVKMGYILSPMIMNDRTYEKTSDKFREMKIEQSIKDEILAKCFIVDIVKGINPSNPKHVTETTIDGLKIKQWTEVLPSDQLGKFNYYPIYQLGPMILRTGPMTHSDPGIAPHIITSVGSIMMTGDTNLDKSPSLGMPSMVDWMEKGPKPDLLLADSTGATKTTPNPTEQDVEDDIVNIVNHHSNNRILMPQLGLQVSRFETQIKALARTDCKTLIICGKALNDLVRILNKTHNIKDWAARQGVTILTENQKLAKKILSGEEEYIGRYAVNLTGPHDETLSAVNKCVRDFHKKFGITSNDVFIWLQGLIPVGDNIYKRQYLKDFLTLFHGAKVYMPDMPSEKENEPVIRHTSGHGSAEDCRRIIEITNRPALIPYHGGPHQIEAYSAIAKEMGVETTRISHETEVIVETGKPLQILHSRPSTYIGIKTLGKNHWDKDDFSAIAITIPPKPINDVGILRERIENAFYRAARLEGTAIIAARQRLGLSEHFKKMTKKGFLRGNIPFGIERYKKSNVFKDKEIHIAIGLDTETSGINTAYTQDHRIHELGLIVQDTATRKTIDTVRLLQAIPEYIIPSVQAALVTGLSFSDMREGDNPTEFTRKINETVKELRALSQQIAAKKKKNDTSLLTNSRKIKMLTVAHNMPFDSRMIQKDMGRNLHQRDRPFETYGPIAVDTRNISRALAAYAPQKYKINKRPDNPNFDDHRLSSLCEAQDIKFNSRKLHGALPDAKLALDLFWKQFSIAPELVGQMIINADTSNNHLLNDITGNDMGINGPHPVFSYISPLSSNPKPQMGCFVANLQNGRDVIIFNLRYRPYEYMKLSTHDILKMAKDPNNDVFEIMDLKRNPIIVPAKFGFEVNANAGLSKETLDQHANIVKEFCQYIDPNAKFKTLREKLIEDFATTQKGFFELRRQEDIIDLDRPISPIEKLGDRPEKGVSKPKYIQSNTSDLQNAEVSELLKKYINAIENTHEDIQLASDAYTELMKHRNALDKAIITINNIHYDICPDDLTETDHAHITQMRKYISHYQYVDAVKEVKNIEEDKSQFDYFIGRSTKKRKLLKEIKQWLEDNKHLGTMDDDMREFAVPHRRFNIAHKNRKNREHALKIA